MTRTEFLTLAQSATRHAATVLAGWLAAKGFTTAGEQVTSLAASGSLLVGTVGWSFVSRSKLLAPVVDAAPFDEVNELASVLQDFRTRGASPLLVAHTAQVLASLAAAEFQNVVPAAAAPPMADEFQNAAPAAAVPPVAQAVDANAGADTPAAGAALPPVDPPLGAPIPAAPPTGPFGVSQ
ncbi:MAG: hypothetical protein KGO96_12305 [Elusimicrobia bacterium]|nr:hypothetical protein [Elusimicrobiota bacterium]MDE2426679.1 hypothetical protein [Elusimicrobiota bacterium]